MRLKATPTTNEQTKNDRERNMHKTRGAKTTTIQTILLKVKCSTSGWSTFNQQRLIQRTYQPCHGAILWIARQNYYRSFEKKENILHIEAKLAERNGQIKSENCCADAVATAQCSAMNKQMSVSLSKCVHTKIIIIHKYGWFILIKAQEKHSKNISYAGDVGLRAYVRVCSLCVSVSLSLIYLSTEP